MTTLAFSCEGNLMRKCAMTNSETKSLIGYLNSPQFTKAYQEQHKAKQAQRKKKKIILIATNRF